MTIFSGETGGVVAELFDGLFNYFSEEGEWRVFKSESAKLDDESRAFLASVISGKVSKEQTLEFMSTCKSKCRIANAIFNLSIELEKTKNQSLVDLCAILASDSWITRFLNRTYFGFWAGAIVKNKLLSSEGIVAIWKGTSHMYPQAWGTPVRDIAKNPNTPNTLLKILYDFDGEEPLRKSIAVHRNADRELQELFVNSGRKRERIAVANSKYLPKDLLAVLAEDKDDDVKYIALKTCRKRGLVN